MIKVNTTPPVLTQQDIDRFWKYVDKSPGHGPRGECWQWIGSKSNRGYGWFSVKSRSLRANRVALFIATGKWPVRLALHDCDWPPCCFPAHLREGTDFDNAQDRVVRGRSAKGLRHGFHTHPESRTRGIRNGAYTKPESVLRGAQKPQSKLTEGSVLIIRALAFVMTRTEIARRYNVSVSTVSTAVTRKLWKHI